MKFIVSSSSLLKHLQQINGAISANTVLPILEDFLFEINKNRLTVIATDLETVMKVQLDIESKETGKVCIPAKILIDSLKNIPDQPLSFTVEKNYSIEITSDNGKYKVMGENPDNYPKEPIANESSSFSINSNIFLNAIDKTLFAVSTDSLRPAMTGVYIELSKDSLQLVATDAHRLVCYKYKDSKIKQEANFIIPKKPLSLLKNVLPYNEDALTISYTNNHVFIQYQTTQLICRLIDARFPDYKVVIPSSNPYKMIIGKNDLQQALRRINVFSNKSTNQVMLAISGSQLQLSAQDIDFSFEGSERMTCQYDGEDMQISFNAKFLIEMLSAIDGEEIKLELSTPNKAGIIKPIEENATEELLMLIMPLN